MAGYSEDLGKMIKRLRLTAGLTLHQLSVMSGVSPSHLGRIERGERLPSAKILRRIAKPLGLDESELFVLAGFLSPQPPGVAERSAAGRLDPFVATVLSQEPIYLQRVALTILSILKMMRKGITSEETQD